MAKRVPDRPHVAAEEAFLSRRGWDPEQLALLKANAPGRDEIERLRRHATWRRDHIEALQDALRAARRLLKAMSSADWPSPDLERALLGGPVETVRGTVHATGFVPSAKAQLERVRQGATGGRRVRRPSFYGAFATLLLAKAAQLRAWRVAGAPARDPTPREIRALFVLAHPDEEPGTDRTAQRRARRDT